MACWTGALSHGLARKKIGERECVGVRQTQQTRERAQGLVLAGADQDRLDAIQCVAQLCRRKADQQRN
jgi:hypothetical protein